MKLLTESRHQCYNNLNVSYSDKEHMEGKNFKELKAVVVSRKMKAQVIVIIQLMQYRMAHKRKSD